MTSTVLASWFLSASLLTMLVPIATVIAVLTWGVIVDSAPRASPRACADERRLSSWHGGRRGVISAMRSRALIATALGATAIGVLVASTIVLSTRSSTQPAGAALADNPTLDPGTPLHGRAADFTLRDQFGRAVSLRQFRGKVVMLAFNDPQCTTICPLTTTAMVDAKRAARGGGRAGGTAGRRRKPGGHRDPLGAGVLGSARDDARLALPQRAACGARGRLARLRDRSADRPGADRPHAGRVRDRHARRARAPLHDADVLLERRAARRALRAGGIAACCRAIRRCAPRAPTPRSRWSNRPPPSACPRAGGGSVRLGPGAAAAPAAVLRHLGLRGDGSRAANSIALDGYAASAPRAGLPALTAIDEASVERSSGALPQFLQALPRPLSYPVAVDSSGRVADGYRVQDEPYLELVSASGRFLWYHDVSAGGLAHPSAALGSEIRAGARARPTADAGERVFAAAARRLSSRARSAARARPGSCWAPSRRWRRVCEACAATPSCSTCGRRGVRPAARSSPCSPSASVSYGRRVAFLGADVEDQAANAPLVPRQPPRRLSQLPGERRSAQLARRRSRACRRRSSSIERAGSCTCTPASTTRRAPSIATSKATRSRAERSFFFARAGICP